MSKLKQALNAVKKVTPIVKGALVLAGHVNDEVTHKRKHDVDKALGKAYRAVEAIERVL